MTHSTSRPSVHSSIHIHMPGHSFLSFLAHQPWHFSSPTITTGNPWVLTPLSWSHCVSHHHVNVFSHHDLPYHATATATTHSDASQLAVSWCPSCGLAPPSYNHHSLDRFVCNRVTTNHHEVLYPNWNWGSTLGGLFRRHQGLHQDWCPARPGGGLQWNERA